MARYKYETTTNYELALSWIHSNICADNIHFRFLLETYRGVKKTIWLTPSKALKFISYTGWLFRYAERLEITKRQCA